MLLAEGKNMNLKKGCAKLQCEIGRVNVPLRSKKFGKLEASIECSPNQNRIDQQTIDAKIFLVVKRAVLVSPKLIKTSATRKLTLNYVHKKCEEARARSLHARALVSLHRTPIYTWKVPIVAFSSIHF